MDRVLHFVLALAVVAILALLVSSDRKKIRIRYVIQLLVIEVLLAWFFLTPVFYDTAMQISAFPLPGVSPGLIFLNPMTGILAFYRRGFMGEALLPEACGLSPAWVWVSAAMCVVVFLLGLWTLRRGDRGFGDVL